MKVFDAVLAVALGLVLLYVLFWWVLVPLVWFPRALYLHYRYTQRGLCPKCHRPASARIRSADQTYGPDRTAQLVCQCGHKSIKMGNRRFADWAGF